MKEQLESLNSLTINFGDGGMAVVNIILAFVMFGVALGIRVQTFKDVFKNPKSVFVGLFLQWVGLPAVTFLAAMILSPVITPMVALGMILVACCPGGNISNFIIYSPFLHILYLHCTFMSIIFQYEKRSFYSIFTLYLLFVHCYITGIT